MTACAAHTSAFDAPGPVTGLIAAAFCAAVSHGAAAAQDGSATKAIGAFNNWCFKAGQTSAEARARMQPEAGGFALTFWDASLEAAPDNQPHGVERRCEVSFTGDHTRQAITALREQMATPPVFGEIIPLPDTHAAEAGTALIEGRELLRGRVAVVHVGTRRTGLGTRTFMAVDRLYAGLGLPEQK